jgi:hypothetical protein
MARQMKNLHLLGAQHFHIRRHGSKVTDPLKMHDKRTSLSMIPKHQITKYADPHLGIK